MQSCYQKFNSVSSVDLLQEIRLQESGQFSIFSTNWVQTVKEALYHITSKWNDVACLSWVLSKEYTFYLISARHLQVTQYKETVIFNYNQSDFFNFINESKAYSYNSNLFILLLFFLIEQFESKQCEIKNSFQLSWTRRYSINPFGQWVTD